MVTKTTDVLIVGGGIHGCSVAYELAKEGLSVVIFESQYVSYGGTGRSTACFRLHFGTELNVELAKYNVATIKQLEKQMGLGIDLEISQWGFLWVAYTDSVLNQLKKNVALHNSKGIKESYILTSAQIKERWPYLKMDGIIGGAFCEQDGHINPHAFALTYAEAAKREGAVINKFCPVRNLIAGNGKIKGLVTENGDVWHAPRVILAAGPWSTPLAATVGLYLPVSPERHNIFVTEKMEILNPPCANVICLDDGAYFKQCTNGSFLIGRDDPNEPRDLGNHGNSSLFLDGVMASVIRRMPTLSSLRLVRQWAGAYDYTPDRQAIVGWSPIEGLFINCGWSGHGLQFAPSISRITKEMFLGEVPFIDIHKLRYSRFEENDLYFEPACV